MSQEHPDRKERAIKYRPEIDGLRTLAVVPVVLYHAGLSAFKGGYVGVDVFFVISGYLITTIIATEITRNRFSLWHFYQRRARRILPALFLVILTCVPFSWLWLMPRDLETFAYSIVAVITFTSNLFFWSETGYFATAAELQPLLHTWSLAVEEQYYIFFPLLMMAIGRRSAAPILMILLVISLIFAAWAVETHPAGAFFLLPSRAWELLVGALAAMYLMKSGPPPLVAVANDALAAVGVAMIAVPIFTYDATTPFPGIHALPPTLGTAMVILFARDGGLVHRILSLRPLVWIGLVSYGTYLWHQPVFALFKHRFGSIAFETYAWPLIGLSFALAFAGYAIVEHPFRKRASNRLLLWSMLASASLSVALAVLLYVQTDKHPETIPSYRWALENADPDLLRYVERRDVRMNCAKEDAFGVQQCTFGAPQARPTLVLWGDSLAGALLSGLHQAAQEASLGGVAFIANGCPPVPGLSNARVPLCKAPTHRDILDRITAQDNVTDVVVFGNLAGAISASNVSVDGFGTSYQSVRRNLSDAAARLKASGARLIVLEQGPTFPEDVSDYLIQNQRHGASDVPTVARAAHIASLAQARGLTDLADLYVETSAFFCGTSECRSVDDLGRLVVYDRTHVTREYSDLLARFLLHAAGL